MRKEGKNEKTEKINEKEKVKRMEEEHRKEIKEKIK